MRILVLLCSLSFFSSLFVLHAENSVSSLMLVKNDTSFLYNYLYNVEGDKVLETKQYYSNGYWINLAQKEWIYTNGKCTDYFERKWTGTSWDNKFKIKYTYTNGNLSLEEQSVFEAGNWTLTDKNEYTYQNDLLKEIREFTLQNSQMVLTSITTHTYSGNLIGGTNLQIYDNNNLSVSYLHKYVYKNNLMDTLLIQIKNSDEWENFVRVHTLYYPDGSLKSTRTQKWDTAHNYWKNDKKITLEYDDFGKVKSEIYQAWNLQFWKDDFSYNYTYNSLGDIEKRTFTQSIYREWRNMHNIFYNEPNVNNEVIIESKFDFWGGKTDELVDWDIPFKLNGEMIIKKGEKIILNYMDTTTGENNLDSLENLLTQILNVYPNPSTGVFYIDPQRHTVYTWAIYDVNGRMIKERIQTEQSGVVDISDLSKGIYIIQANTDKGKLHQKLIKK